MVSCYANYNQSKELNWLLAEIKWLLQKRIKLQRKAKYLDSNS
jgi:hypothetical protein